MRLTISQEDCKFLIRAVRYYTAELVNTREACFDILHKKDKKSVEKFNNDLKKLADRDFSLTEKLSRLGGYSIKEKVSDAKI